MVTPGLQREFERNGVSLIPLAAGAQAMVREMCGAPQTAPVEVVIGGQLPLTPNLDITNPEPEKVEPADEPQAVSGADNTAAGGLKMRLKRDIDLAECPVLADHRLGGKPVVPFALITEWLGHGALASKPGLSLHGIDEIRLLHGIKLEAARKTIRLMAGDGHPLGDNLAVEVEIRNGFKDGKPVVHSRGRAILARSLLATVYAGPTVFDPQADLAIKLLHNLSP